MKKYIYYIYERLSSKVGAYRLMPCGYSAHYTAFRPLLVSAKSGRGRFWTFIIGNSFYMPPYILYLLWWVTLYIMVFFCNILSIFNSNEKRNTKEDKEHLLSVYRASCVILHSYYLDYPKAGHSGRLDKIYSLVLIPRKHTSSLFRWRSLLYANESRRCSAYSKCLPIHIHHDNNDRHIFDIMLLHRHSENTAETHKEIEIPKILKEAA